MIHVSFDPSTLEGEDKIWWERWQKRAHRATKKAIAAWKDLQDSSKIKFTEKVWGDLNKWLRVHFFHNKCSYCETSNPQYWPDGEHYRPKRGVDAKLVGATGLTPVQVQDHTGTQVPHPGYFWLAYDWRNLIPGCRSCNSGLEAPGKLNRFDVAKQHTFLTRLTEQDKEALKEKPYPSLLGPDLYYLSSTDLNDVEGPLLLHPYRDYPEHHLSFEPGGVVVGTTSQGLDTIETCNLRYEPLRVARQAAQENGAQQYGIQYLANLRGHHASIRAAWEAAWDALQDIRCGKAAYSAAVRAHVSRAFPQPP